MASELATCIATVDVLEFVVRSVCGAHGAPEHRLFAALLIMPLALLVTLAGEAQMGAIGPESKDGAPLAPSGMTAMPEKLYVSATFAKAAEPALLAPASASAITLSPPYKRTRNFAEEGLTDRLHPFRAAAFGLKASTLGAGAKMAVPIARKLNARVGASSLNWTHTFSTDGIQYAPGLKFRAGQGTVEWFPHHDAFHISVGALYFHNHIAGNAAIAGQSLRSGTPSTR